MPKVQYFNCGQTGHQTFVFVSSFWRCESLVMSPFAGFHKHIHTLWPQSPHNFLQCRQMQDISSILSRWKDSCQVTQSERQARLLNAFIKIPFALKMTNQGKSVKKNRLKLYQEETSYSGHQQLLSSQASFYHSDMLQVDEWHQIYTERQSGGGAASRL